MEALARKLEPMITHMSKKDVELSLDHIADQIRRIEQKLTIRVGKEIEEGFEKNQKAIIHLESLIKYGN